MTCVHIVVFFWFISNAPNEERAYADACSCLEKKHCTQSLFSGWSGYFVRLSTIFVLFSKASMFSLWLLFRQPIVAE